MAPRQIRLSNFNRLWHLLAGAPLMRNHRPPSEPTRFESNLRHYHRTGAPAQRTWDEWVDGSKVKPRSSRKWLKILGIVVGLLALCWIIVGLIVEMG